MITIVDYGVGNVQAFLNVYNRLNIPAARAATAAELSGASKVILPGVGAFDHAMERLEASGMRAVLDELALDRRVPILGVCVGMQMLARGSEEGGRPGLSWIGGQVRAFASTPQFQMPLPHMGWNDVRPIAASALFRGLESDAKFYFLHSFYFTCVDDAAVAATSGYGIDFTSAVSSGNIYGVQFHPEKSHHYGTRLLSNFAGL